MGTGESRRILEDRKDAARELYNLAVVSNRHSCEGKKRIR